MVAAKRLDRSEEDSLARLIQKGDDKAKDMLVQRNLPLVFHIAKRFKGPLPLEDRIQEGVTGLIRAAERFDPGRGVRFGTYAAWWIRQAISRAIANQSREIRIPVQMHVRLRRLEKEVEHLGRKLGHNPSMEELSEETGLGQKKLSHFARINRSTVSLSLLPGESESNLGEMDDGYGVHKSPERQVLKEMLRGKVARSLETLNPRERYVVGRRFGLFGEDGETLNRIAAELKLSRERVRQIVNGALRKIRESDHAEDLRDFY